ncbi:hypothetical protein SK79_01222 [Escherichia coli]|nr:hypothetical protein SK79_01222 [Escherichia coli]
MITNQNPQRTQSTTNTQIDHPKNLKTKNCTSKSKQRDKTRIYPHRPTHNNKKTNTKIKKGEHKLTEQAKDRTKRYTTAEHTTNIKKPKNMNINKKRNNPEILKQKMIPEQLNKRNSYTNLISNTKQKQKDEQVTLNQKAQRNIKTNAGYYDHKPDQITTKGG